MRFLKIMIPLLTAAMLLTSCSESGTEKALSAEREIFAMDTYISISAEGEESEEALERAVSEIDRLENLLSVGREDSEIAQLNASGEAVLSDEVMALVDRSLEIWTLTDGAFDITVYPLMELWGFTTGEFRVPASEEISAVLSYVGFEKLTQDPAAGLLILGECQGVDLGGIAKGYAAEQIAHIFDSYSLNGGIVSLGGDVWCSGRKNDGSLWRVGIRDALQPDDETALLGVLELSDTAVFTSGAYERNFTDAETGITYHHILDPATGCSADSGLISVTVVSTDGILADGLSTACYVMGLDASEALWRENASDFDLILMTDDGEIYITQGLTECFTSDYPIRLIEALS